MDLTLNPALARRRREEGGGRGRGRGVGWGFFFPAFNFAFQARDADRLDPEENLCTAAPYSQLLSEEQK